MKRLIIILSSALALSACSSLNLDKDRAAEQRKQELCTEIATKDLPHCSGSSGG